MGPPRRRSRRSRRPQKTSQPARHLGSSLGSSPPTEASRRPACRPRRANRPSRKLTNMRRTRLRRQHRRTARNSTRCRMRSSRLQLPCRQLRRNWPSPEWTVRRRLLHPPSLPSPSRLPPLRPRPPTQRRSGPGIRHRSSRRRRYLITCRRSLSRSLPARTATRCDRCKLGSCRRRRPRRLPRPSFPTRLPLSVSSSSRVLRDELHFFPRLSCRPPHPSARIRRQLPARQSPALRLSRRIHRRSELCGQKRMLCVSLH